MKVYHVIGNLVFDQTLPLHTTLLVLRHGDEGVTIHVEYPGHYCVLIAVLFEERGV